MLACFLWQDAAMSTTNSKFKFRNAQAQDINPLAEMCAETFDGPFSWLDGLKKKKSVDTFEQQFRERHTRLVQGGIQHAMVLCETAGPADESKARETVAFLEVGLLPCPILVKTMWEGEETETRPEVPFLGNVAVSPAHRRLGLATKLVKIAEKIAQKWAHDGIYVAVEADNPGALSLYRKLDFRVVLDERDQMNRRGNRIFMRKGVSLAASQPVEQPGTGDAGGTASAPSIQGEP